MYGVVDVVVVAIVAFESPGKVELLSWTKLLCCWTLFEGVGQPCDAIAPLIRLEPDKVDATAAAAAAAAGSEAAPTTFLASAEGTTADSGGIGG